MSKGIVIHAGGSTYLTNAWITSRLLRQFGCKLPIQWWIRDNGERLPWTNFLADRVEATVHEFSKYRRRLGAPKLSGWARKPFSILHSDLDEVLLLDADNFLVRDPTYLFRHDLYRKTGTLFWPDFKPMPPDNPVWAICSIPPNLDIGFQGGQQIINKTRPDVLRALHLAVAMNNDHGFWYGKGGSDMFYGEQDTYRFAWMMEDVPYSVIPVPAGALKKCILEFDPEGRRVFQHRCACKFGIDGRENPMVKDFWFQDDCFMYLEQYRQITRSYQNETAPYYSVPNLGGYEYVHTTSPNDSNNTSY